METLTERYERACTGAASPDCQALRARLERALYDDLNRLYAEGGAADHDTLVLALGAQDAPLAAFALRRLADRLAPEDEPLVLAALENPFPLVRRTATALLFQLQDPRGVRLARRAPPDDGSPGVVADVVPTADVLGAALPDGARFRHFPSGGGRAVFAVPGSPASVRDTYLGAEILAVDVAKARLTRPASPTADVLRAFLASGGERRVLRAAWRRQDRLRTWLDAVAAEEGTRDLAVVWIPGTTIAGVDVPRTLVAVYADDILETTVVALPTPRVLAATVAQ